MNVPCRAAVVLALQPEHQQQLLIARSLRGKRGYPDNGVARTLQKLRTSKGDYCIKQLFSTITPLFKMGTALKGKNLLPEGANSFL